MPAFNEDGLELLDAPAGVNEDGLEIISPATQPRGPIPFAQQSPGVSPYNFQTPAPVAPNFARGAQVIPSLSPTAEEEATANQGVIGAAIAKTRQAGAAGFGELAKTAPWLLGEFFGRSDEPQFDPTAAEQLQGIRESAPYRFGEELQASAKEAFPVAREQEKKFLVKAGGTAGGLAPFLLAGEAGPAVIAMQSFGAHLGDDIDELKSRGLSEEQASQKIFDRALASGSTAQAIFTALPGSLKKLGEKWIVDKFGTTALKAIVAKTAAGAAEGAVLMPAAHAAENVISERPVTEGLGESAVAGAMMLGIPKAAGAVLRPNAYTRTRESVARPPAPREEPYQFGTPRAEDQDITDRIIATADRRTPPPIEVSPQPSAPPKPPRATVPGTPSEERITAVEEIRRAKATTIRQIQALFPRAELSREQARVYRDLAWPTLNSRAITEREALSPVGALGKPAVGDVVKYRQILNSVVTSIPVDVVDMLGGKERTLQMLLHDKPVLSDALSSNLNEDVFIRARDSLGESIAAARTKLSSSPEDRAANANFISALDALNKRLVEIGWSPVSRHPDRLQQPSEKRKENYASSERAATEVGVQPEGRKMGPQAPLRQPGETPSTQPTVVPEAQAPAASILKAAKDLDAFTGKPAEFWPMLVTGAQDAAGASGSMLLVKSGDEWKSITITGELSGAESGDLIQAADHVVDPKRGNFIRKFSAEPTDKRYLIAIPLKLARESDQVAVISTVFAESEAEARKKAGLQYQHFGEAPKRYQERLMAQEKPPAQESGGKSSPPSSSEQNEKISLKQSNPDRALPIEGQPALPLDASPKQVGEKTSTKPTGSPPQFDAEVVDLDGTKRVMRVTVLENGLRISDPTTGAYHRINFPSGMENPNPAKVKALFDSGVKVVYSTTPEHGTVTTVERISQKPKEAAADPGRPLELPAGTAPPPPVTKPAVVAKANADAEAKAKAAAEFAAQNEQDLPGTIETAAQKLAAQIRAAKSGNLPPGATPIFVIPPKLLDAALEVMARTVEQGGKIADVVVAGVEYIRARMKEGFDENRVRRQLEAIMAAKEKLKSPEFDKAREIEGQVMGIRRAGLRYGQENIAATLSKLRQWEQGPESEGQTRKPGPFNFGPDVPVTPENTQRAFQTIANLIDLPTAESELLRIRDAAPEQMAPGLLLSDIFRYAVRSMMGKQGDPSLVYYIAENYDRINTTTGPMGPRGIGRALRALREGASDPTLINLLQLFDAMEQAASSKLYGREKLEEIAGIARDVQAGVTEEMSKPEPAAQIEQKVKDEGLTPEIAWLMGLKKRYQEWNTEWVKPNFRKSLLSEIKGIVKDWEQRNLAEVDQPLAGQDFQRTLGDLLNRKALQSIEEENARREAKSEATGKPIKMIELDDEMREMIAFQMRRLAREIWLRKTAAAADRRPNVEQRWAENALSNWEKEQAEWLKPDKIKPEAQKAIEQFMDLAPFEPEQKEAEVAKLAKAISDAGVLPGTAFQMAEMSWSRKLRFEANARLKAEDLAAKRIWNESEGVARGMLAKMRTMKIPMTDENGVREAIKRAMRLRPTKDEIATYGDVEASRRVDPVSAQQYSQKLVEELVAAGVQQDTAIQLAREIQLDRLFRWNSANSQTMQNAAKSRKISGLMDELLAAPILMQKSPQWRSDTARRWFESNGLSKEDAERAANVFTAEFDAQLDAAAKQLAERLGRRENFSGERFKDFVAAIRAGMLDPSKPWAMKFAEAKGIRLPNPEEMKKLAELDAKLEGLRERGSERDMAEVGSEMMAIYSKMHLPPELLKVVAANVVATNLTGLRTLVVQGSPLVYAALDRAYATLAAPHRVRQIWSPFFHAVSGMMAEIKLATSKDAYTFVNNEMTPASNTLRRLWETGLDDAQSDSKFRQAKGIAKMLFGSQQYFLRLLNAMDQASGIMVRESQLVQYGSDAMRKAGFSHAEIDDWVEATHKLKQAAYLTSIGNGDSPTRAQVHADAFGAEMIRVHLQEKLIEKGVDPSAAITQANEAWKAAENDAYSVIGRMGHGIQENEEGGLLSRYGFLHSLLKLSGAMRRGESQDRILAVTMLGYVNVPIRTARFYAWNSPYGLLRMGIHYGRKAHFEKQGIDYYASNRNWWKQSLANEAQANYRMKNAVAATAVQAALTAAGIAYFGQSSSNVDTKKDNQIFVTGDGPKNKEMRDAWLKSGFRQNSVVFFVNGKPATMPLTRLGEPLAHMFWLLSARDDYNWRKKEKEAAGKPFKETWQATTGYALGNYAALIGQRGPLATVARWAKATGSEGGSSMLLGTGLASVAASATMPYLGMQRTIRDIAMGKVDTSSVTAAMAANFPVLGAFQNRAINRFGDPLGNRLWSAVIGDAAGTVSFQVEDNPQNRKLYQTLVDKGIAPPTLRRGVLEEKYGQMTNSNFGTFAQRSGDMLKKATLANLSVIEKQSPEDAKKTVAKLAQTADNVAAKGLGLESVRTARSTGGGMTLPASSGSSGGLLEGSAGLLSGSSGPASAFSGRAASFRGGTRPKTRRLSAGRRIVAPRSRRLTSALRRPRTLRTSQRRLTAGLRRPGLRLRRLSLV